MSDYRIAVVAPPWYPVPPVGYGGIELVVDLLMRGLRSRGVEAVLYATEGSAHDAVALAPAHWSLDLGRTFHGHREAAYLARVVADMAGRGFDLIHDHAGWSSPLIFSQSGLPTLHTVHGPIIEQSETLYRALGDRVGLVAISADQRRHAPDLGWVGTVHNAVDIDALHPVGPGEKEGYLLCLARISPEKGQHVAIEVARRCRRPLILAGKIGERDAEQRYFDEQIAPHVDGRRVTYLDNVSGRNKAQLLARASSLLAPLQWAEPFGLAMVEAMASGTPAIAFGRGAAPELIKAGVTGLIASDIDAMVAAVSFADEIDPAECAAEARARFSPLAMADRYIALYEGALFGEEPTGNVVGGQEAEATLAGAARVLERLP